MKITLMNGGRRASDQFDQVVVGRKTVEQQDMVKAVVGKTTTFLRAAASLISSQVKWSNQYCCATDGRVVIKTAALRL
jgi:hypothetical protein